MTFDDTEDFATNNVEHSLPFCARDCTQTTSHPIARAVAPRRLDVPPNLQELFRALEGSLIGNRGWSESGITAGHDWAEYRGYSGVDGRDQRSRAICKLFGLRTLLAERTNSENKDNPFELRLLNPGPATFRTTTLKPACTGFGRFSNDFTA
jgi:hypothetical protein